MPDAAAIQHVFVLMLENRSFDHMLGFSAITGADAVTGQPTIINGLTGAESNSWNGHSYGVAQPAAYAISVDPAHEFPDAVVQFCGPGVMYAFGSPYPNVLNNGFVASFASGGGQGNPADVMKCYSPSQLPVLNALAREFVVCDNWHAPIPGPTWPNRFFAHAASSSGLDHSPTTAEIVLWETLCGFSFANGTIFDMLNRHNVHWRLYAGDDFPLTAALKGIQLPLVRPYRHFLDDVARADYDVAYTFIEPSYNVLADYRCSTSQHPLGDVTRGEGLIKCTYEAIRNSPVWQNSLLVITWDEHGGFYDHAAPPAAVAPGDTHPGSDHNQFGFTFEQYGGRVPAVVVSPRIPRNLVDHRLYDHTSILATLEDIFDMDPLTQRDAAANRLTPLCSLATARTDAPLTLPSPAASGVTGCPPFNCTEMPQLDTVLPHLVARPEESVNQGNVAGVLQAALRSDLALSPDALKSKIMARFSSLKTRDDAQQYANDVKQKVQAAKAAINRRT